MGGEISRVIPPSKTNPKGSAHSPQHASSLMSGTLGPLYIGSMQCIFNHEQVFPTCNIRAVVSCMTCDPDGLDHVLLTHRIDKSLDYLLVPLEDSRGDDFEKLLPKITTTVKWIHERRIVGKAVLVHCDGGITRSASVVCAYLMRYGPIIMEDDPITSMTLSVAKAYIKQSRPKINVRLFETELQAYERQLENGITTPTQTSPGGCQSHSPSLPASRSMTPCDMSFLGHSLTLPRLLVLPTCVTNPQPQPPSLLVDTGRLSPEEENRPCLFVAPPPVIGGFGVPQSSELLSPSINFSLSLGTIPLPLGIKNMIEKHTLTAITETFLQKCREHSLGTEVFEILTHHPRAVNEKMIGKILEYSGTEPTTEELDEICHRHAGISLEETHFDVLQCVLLQTLTVYYDPWNSETQGQWSCAVNLLFSDVIQHLEKLTHDGSGKKVVSVTTPVVPHFFFNDDQ